MTVLWYVAATGEMLGLSLVLIVLSLWIADRLERRCTCLFEPWPAATGVETDEDGTRWIVYPRCRVHGQQQRTRITGDDKAAVVRTAA